MAYITEESNISLENLVAVSMRNGGVDSKITQTFTANRTYTLQALVFFVGAFEPPPSVSVAGGIYSVSGGEPNAKLEDFTMIATQDRGISQEEIAILDSPLELTEGVQYAIVMNEPTSGFFYTAYRSEGGSTYAGGVGLRYTEGSWGALPSNNDFYFRTYSSFSLTPTPSHEAEGIVLFPTLGWVID